MSGYFCDMTAAVTINTYDDFGNLNCIFIIEILLEKLPPI